MVADVAGHVFGRPAEGFRNLDDAALASRECNEGLRKLNVHELLEKDAWEWAVVDTHAPTAPTGLTGAK